MSRPARRRSAARRHASLAPAHFGLIVRLVFSGPVAFGLGFALPASAQTAAKTVTYNIPAGPLADALNQYAQQAGVSLAMDARQLRGLTSPGLRGSHGIEAGFNLLLRGSGYLAYKTESGYVLRPAPVSSQNEVATLPAVTAVASAPSTQGYVAARSVAATKTDTSLLETPQSASVITREELDDRNVQTLLEAVSYTPGVRTEQSGFDPRFDVFTLRGFDVTYNGIYRDGLRLPGANMSVFKVEPYSVENVTVLRGPSSALYGLGSPGGLVDITSKRPIDEPFGEVQLMTGNYQRKQGQFDIGGRADEDGQWLYRLTGVVRDAGSPNTDGGGNNDITSIAPAFTWQPNSDTKVTLLGEYLKSRTPAALPYYAWGGARSDLPGATGDYNRQDQEQFRVGYLAEHRFNDTFTVRQNLRYGQVNTHVRYNSLGEIDAEANTISRSTGYVHDKLKSFVVDNQLQADFKTGDVEHKLLVGLDYSYLGLDGGIGYGAASDLDASTLEPLGPTEDPPTDASRYRQRQRQTGLYLQEQAKFDGWIVTLTGRHDWSTSIADDLIADSREKTVDRKFTGRAGLTHVFDNGIAPYVSYSTSFAPTSGVDANGQTFDPTTARQVEAGVKYAPSNMNSYVAASVFELKQSNALVTDPNNPLFQVQTGKVRSRGIELEGMLDLAQGLKVHGAYTYLMAVNMSGSPETDGRTLSGTPRHTFSLWTDYTFQSDTALAGLDVGFGLRYVGTSWGNATNTFQNSAHLLADAKIGYDLGRLSPSFKGWSAQVNALNLFDRDYTTCDAGYCYEGAPRMVTASLKYRW